MAFDYRDRPSLIQENWREQSEADRLQLTLTSLDQSTALYHSCIDQEAIAVNQSQTQSQTRGAAIVRQFENLLEAAIVLNRVLNCVKKHNTNLVTTGFTLSAGITALWNGNIPWGVSLTGVALNEVRKIVFDYYNSTTTKTASLVNEIQTGLLMIEQLEEYQQSSLDTIERQITLATEQLTDIEKQLEEIKKLSCEGFETGEIKKREAEGFCKQAESAYRQALSDLEESKKNIALVNKGFTSIIKKMEELVEQAQQGKIEQSNIDSFIKETKQILDKMMKIQERIATSQESLNNGLTGLHEASTLNKNSLQKYAEAVVSIQHYLMEIQRKDVSEKIGHAKEHAKEAKKEVAHAKQRVENIQEIAKYEREKAQEVQKKLEEAWGSATIAIGMTATAAGIVLGGGILSVPVGVGVSGLAHYTRRIYSFTQQFFQKTEGEKQLTHLQVAYNSTSTGWGGYAVGLASKAAGGEGRASKTVGVVAVDLHQDTPSVYKFNKGSPSKLGKMDESDIKRLHDDLRQAIADERLTHRECVQIIDSLTHVPTEHGTVAMIAPDCLFLRELIRECKAKS